MWVEEHSHGHRGLDGVLPGVVRARARGVGDGAGLEGETAHAASEYAIEYRPVEP